MNKRGEVEIAINKRILERSLFLLVIIVLGVLLALKWNGNSGDVTPEDTTALQEQLDAATSAKVALETELAEVKAELEEVESKPAPAIVPATPAPIVAPTTALSGKVIYDWDVEGEVQTPLIYNGEEIKKLEDEIALLEEELDGASGQSRSQIDDDISAKETEIRDLKKGDTKYKLKAVTITIDNGKPEDAVFDYVICWAAYDCAKIKSSGTISVASGKKVTEDVKLTFPTFLLMDKVQLLRVIITQDDKEVFKDELTIRV